MVLWQSKWLWQKKWPSDFFLRLLMLELEEDLFTLWLVTQTLIFNREFSETLHTKEARKPIKQTLNYSNPRFLRGPSFDEQEDSRVWSLDKMVLLVLSFKEKRKSFFPSLLLLALFLIMGGDLRYFFSSSILHFSRLAPYLHCLENV